MKIHTLYLAAFFLFLTAAKVQAEPKKYLDSIEAEGYQWDYSTVVPSSYNNLKKFPLLILLHGAGGNAEGYLRKTGWSEKAEKEGFIAVAPNGLAARPARRANFLFNPALWNSGVLPPNSPRSKIDDVVFFKKLLEKLYSQYQIDRSKVFLTGHSNGGGMTFYLATQLSNEFKAIAPVASALWTKEAAKEINIPTLYILGEADPLVPVQGGERKTPWGRSLVPSHQESIETWAKILGCSKENKLISNSPPVKIYQYCVSNKKPFFVYSLEGQGHEWPGGERMLPVFKTGEMIKDFKATDIIWDFFKQISL